MVPSESMCFQASSSESSEDGAEDTDIVKTVERKCVPVMKPERRRKKSSEEVAVENYTKTKRYIKSDKGKGMDVKILDEEMKTSTMMNCYVEKIKQHTKNKNGKCRKEGEFGGVRKVVEGLLGEQESRSALSKMVEVFTLIVDLHDAAEIELFNGERTVGLTECLRLMTGK